MYILIPMAFVYDQYPIPAIAFLCSTCKKCFSRSPSRKVNKSCWLLKQWIVKWYYTNSDASEILTMRQRGNEQSRKIGSFGRVFEEVKCRTKKRKKITKKRRKNFNGNQEWKCHMGLPQKYRRLGFETNVSVLRLEFKG